MRGLKGTLILAAAAVCLFTGLAGRANAGQIQVAYAGSMGVVMDRFLGPQFGRAHEAQYQGIGHGAYALARLILSKQLRPDVFVSVTRGPMELLLRSGLVAVASPVASTQMVITYNPRSRFAGALKEAATGSRPWFSVLEEPGLKFGRTDPSIDPQGRNIIFTFLLAERYYHRPNLVKKILGALDNPVQIFTETSLLSRMEAGQIDASSGYRSAAVSHGLPYIALPPEINLGDAAYAKSWYSSVELQIRGPYGAPETLHTQPLIFYAATLAGARHPRLAEAFVSYLRSSQAQAVFRSHGYGPPSGPQLR